MIRPLYEMNDNGCWVWQRGTCNGYGWYGRQYAHRVMYEWEIGGLTKADHLHHKCHNKMCVNPFHLVKTSRNSHQKHHQQERKYCVNGHLRNSSNAQLTHRGWRCRVCNTERQKKYNARDGLKRHRARLAVVNGIRKDFEKMPTVELAKKYGVSQTSIYRYLHATPKKLGYFS